MTENRTTTDHSSTMSRLPHTPPTGCIESAPSAPSVLSTPSAAESVPVRSLTDERPSDESLSDDPLPDDQLPDDPMPDDPLPDQLLLDDVGDPESMTPGDGDALAAGSPHPVGVRVRIVMTVLALTAIGMSLAGTSFMVFERQQLVSRLDAVLLSDADQFRRSAAEALRTSDASLSLDELFDAELRTHTPAAGETLLALVDGRLHFVVPGSTEKVTTPEFLGELAARPADAPTQIRQFEQPNGNPVRYLAMQVSLQGQSQVGTFVSAVPIQPELDEISQSARFYALLSSAALLLVGVGAWIVSGRLLRPLRLLREAAENISHTDLTARIPVTGRDDVTELTRTVNAMFDRLENAFATQQRFLDDAGHELRTPITIVRGHLEVMDAGDAHEVSATRELVLDEVDRMAELVNELIVLAQSGRPDFITLAPLNLDHWLREVLDKSQALADRHWTLDATTSTVVMADGHRLTQAMLQLAENAVRFTSEDDVIAFGGAQSAGRVLLWVRDTGTGVAPQDAERIFRRFQRASGQHQDETGSGLGLSIVSRIAAGHGGRVDLDPGYGSGARFTITLPLRRTPSTLQRPTTDGGTT